MLLAQPNRDRSYSVTLFLPVSAADPVEPSFDTLTRAVDVETFFRTRFPDAFPLLPHLTDEFLARPRASLRIVKASRYHHGRAVLIGDAAHTMVPFYGQGINCGFEDVHVFFDILDRLRARHDFVPQAVAEFTAARLGPCHAITDLSRAHLARLSEPVEHADLRRRDRVEELVHKAHPDYFAPLYGAIAFSSVPYDEVIAAHDRGRKVLDDLFENLGRDVEPEEIAHRFARRMRASEAVALDDL